MTPVRRHLCRHVSSAFTLGRTGGFLPGCFPHPDTMKLWPQFRSPLRMGCVRSQHVFHHRLPFVLVYRTTGLTSRRIRDRAQTRGKQVNLWHPGNVGWRGSAVHWQRHQTAYFTDGGIGDAPGLVGGNQRCQS